MTSLRFRLAQRDDIGPALALIESAFRGDSARRGWSHEADLLGGQRTDATAIAEIIADPAKTLLLAERNEQFVGCVLVTDLGARNGAHCAYFGMLTVSPLLQGAGLGKRLLAEAERHARSFGAAAMEMGVIKQRTELIDWYHRRGYRVTSREEPFPLDDPRYGIPKRRDLVFVIMERAL